MSKSSHFTGQPVYSQVLKLLDKAEIRRISRSTGSSERYVKRLDGLYPPGHHAVWCTQTF